MLKRNDGRLQFTFCACCRRGHRSRQFQLRLQARSNGGERAGSSENCARCLQNIATGISMPDANCRCDQCAAEPAPTWTEQWRHECEVRHVARLTVEERRSYINDVAASRGTERAIRLMRDVMLNKSTPRSARER